MPRSSSVSGAAASTSLGSGWLPWVGVARPACSVGPASLLAVLGLGLAAVHGTALAAPASRGLRPRRAMRCAG